MSLDLVICRFPGEISNHAAITALELGKPILSEIVACVRDGLSFHGSFKARAYSSLAYKRMKVAIQKSTFALYVTDKFLQQRYPCRGITAGISDVSLPQVESRILDLRLRNSPHSGPYVIGIIGSMANRMKGIHDAIRMLKSLIDEGVNVQLRILGNGDSTYCRRLSDSLGILENVFFDGFLPPGVPVFSWLDNLDLYVQPSYTEGMPRALLEAMSRGLPCATSSAGGMPEVVDKKLIFPPGDINSFVSAVKSILFHPDFSYIQSSMNFETASKFSDAVLSSARSEFYHKAFDRVLAHKFAEHS